MTLANNISSTQPLLRLKEIRRRFMLGETTI